MLEWLDRVFPLAKEPNLFAEALKQIDENIGRYPEWMLGGDEFCALGPHATACVLRWTWQACEGHAARGREFLERIYGLNTNASGSDWRANNASSSLSHCRKEYWREIHTRLSEEEYAEARDDTRSVWHRIHHHLEQRFDPSAYSAVV